MADKLKNLLSRKFLIAVAGVLCGISTAIGGDTTNGAILIISSVLGYLVAEGFVDAKAVASAAAAITDVAEAVGGGISSEAEPDEAGSDETVSAARSGEA
ncbi:MAG TPA: hypothetical protein DD735_11825 [Clostridiales bacterium]|jgi:hypothetical protein|nr:hypothetical protein [Clostridiales bacterium]